METGTLHIWCVLVIPWTLDGGIDHWPLLVRCTRLRHKAVPVCQHEGSPSCRHDISAHIQLEQGALGIDASTRRHATGGRRVKNVSIANIKVVKTHASELSLHKNSLVQVTVSVLQVKRQVTIGFASVFF